MPQGAHFLRLPIKLRGQNKFDSRGLASRGPSPRRHAPDRCAVESCLCEYMAENLRNSACMPAYQASRPGPNGNWDARGLRLSIGRQGRDGREQLGRKKKPTGEGATGGLTRTPPGEEHQAARRTAWLLAPSLADALSHTDRRGPPRPPTRPASLPPTSHACPACRGRWRGWRGPAPG